MQPSHSSRKPGPIFRDQKNPGDTEEGLPVSSKSLINQINFLHFQKKNVWCRFEHRQDKQTVRLPLAPQPTLGKSLVLLWPDRPEIQIRDYCLKEVTVPMEEARAVFSPRVSGVTDRGLCLRLPESIQATAKKIRKWRYPDDALVKIRNDRISFTGNVDDIRDNTVIVALADGAGYDVSGQEDPQTIFSVSFVKDRRILFSGQFSPVDARTTRSGVKLRLTPANPIIHRQHPKKFRSTRLSVLPTPDANTVHPLHNGYISMDVHDLSGAGFSIECEEDEFGLITGLVFPAIELNFAGALSIPCSAQVMHRRTITTAEGETRILFGFSFIDISPDDHLKLMSILIQKKDPNVRLCQAVDEHSLWSFFFETGFLYAKKYKSLQKKADRIRETYRKLYIQGPSISRHFVYREKGKIIGHLSMLRMYHDAWLIHHHAARRHREIKAGLTTLNHMSWFCNNSLWLEDYHMRYLVCYFRPENAFPRFFFYEFAQQLNDKAGCSTDTFAYLTGRRPTRELPGLPDGWRLELAGPEDLSLLSRRYGRQSGGLALHAMDLTPSSPASADLDNAYHDAGFHKERHLYALKNGDRLIAVALVTVTDIALNLSDLTNCLTVFVLDEDGFPPDIWTAALKRLAGFFHHKQFTVLLHPLSYAEKQDIPYQKKYTFWVLATRYSDHFFEHLTQADKMIGSNQEKETV